MTRNRLMPKQINLGQHMATTMAHCMLRRENFFKEGGARSGGRYVMGYRLPSWQRPLVWTKAQMVSFIESAWRGIPLGTYTYNITDHESPLDDLLIDGQQRMHAIERYINDDFQVFGHYWSEVTEVDRRIWEMSVQFGCYRTQTQDEDYLRNYYNLTNFGGTPHKEHERA